MTSSTVPEPSDSSAGEEPPASATCGHCGTTAPLDLTWTSAVERGRTRHFCPACSRLHLRSMEAKLDSEWW